MDSFNFARMKSYLPEVPDLSKLPSLPKNLPSIPKNLPSMPKNLPPMPQLRFALPTVGGLTTPPLPTENDDAAHLDAQSTAYASPSQLNPLDPSPIDDSRPKSNLDIVAACDNFPYLSTHPELYFRHVNHYYHLQVAALPGICLGYIVPRVAAVFEGLQDWTVDHDERTVVLVNGTNVEERSEIVRRTTAAMRELNYFEVLKGWRDEQLSVHGLRGEVLFTVERAASALLGMVTYGCHLTAYKTLEKDGTTELRLWIPRRAKSKQTWGGYLDNTVAGGLATGEEPEECMIREAEEEASLPAELLKKKLRPAGLVTYFHIRDKRVGGEQGLLMPECQYVYDLDLTGEDVEPKPQDGEVESFELMSVEEVQDAIKKDEFKANCALVLLDFFVRHGILTAENEKDYVRIVTRLRRGIDFPTRQ